MNNVIIRDALKTDLNEIYKLINILEENVFDKKKFSQVFNDTLKNRKIFFKVAIIDNKIAGFISLSIQAVLHHAGYIAEIHELVIVPELRCMNIGKSLLDEVEKIALSNNCELIELASNKNRVRAHKFYENNGYINSHYKLTKKLS